MKKNNHLKLVDPNNLNPENLTYDQIEEKINGLMEILDFIQELNLDDEFPHIENKIKFYIELQNSVVELNPPPPPFEVEALPDNVVDMSVLFTIKKFENNKAAQAKKAQEEMGENVVSLFPNNSNNKTGTDTVS